MTSSREPQRVVLVHGMACQGCGRDLATSDVLLNDEQAIANPEWPLPFSEDMCRLPLYDPQCGGRLSLIDPVVGGSGPLWWTCKAEPFDSANARWQSWGGKPLEPRDFTPEPPPSAREPLDAGQNAAKLDEPSAGG